MCSYLCLSECACSCVQAGVRVCVCVFMCACVSVKVSVRLLVTVFEPLNILVANQGPTIHVLHTHLRPLFQKTPKHAMFSETECIGVEENRKELLKRAPTMKALLKLSEGRKNTLFWKKHQALARRPFPQSQDRTQTTTVRGELFATAPPGLMKMMTSNGNEIHFHSICFSCFDLSSHSATHTHSLTHTYTHSHTLTQIQTRTHTLTHTHTPTHTDTHAHAHILPETATHTRTHTHNQPKNIHTHTQTHTRTHTFN